MTACHVRIKLHLVGYGRDKANTFFYSATHKSVNMYIRMDFFSHMHTFVMETKLFKYHVKIVSLRIPSAIQLKAISSVTQKQNIYKKTRAKCFRKRRVL
jgi:hypothetical protein